MKNINRRGILRTGIAGAAGIAISQSINASFPDIKEDKVAYRTLGRTGLQVPVVSFGVMQSDNPRLCMAAFEKGIKLFDTANGYSDRIQAYDLVKEPGYGNNPCSNCIGNCLVNCSRNFDIKRKISDTSRITNVPAEFLT